ncbi:extracellular solute-binding protein [Spirochaeta africana]|uniref:Maltose-binding periplasmic protein n=1 Tax=Spirochaeta africana (strain ATCC 700263 / DSM 8902 / Z-7692) TaxID=889378 RepID=H9UI87_SPIAZ|nr:extracellular solute-binding protein [Spirochaeta africana]AFG37230.1 maltose-binding periplasmic protein [Spirochaeta africana DSM 8902]
MKRILTALILMLIATGMVFAAGQQGPPPGATVIELWTNEGEADGGFQYVTALAKEYMQQNPDVWISVQNKGTEDLREDFITASLAGGAPQLLWTVNDHAGPFVIADLIQPVGDMYDEDAYIDGVYMEGQNWGVPIYGGNHLMLMYNRKFVPEAPQTTDEMIEIAQRVMAENEGVYGLVWDMAESFWTVPWLAGFGGGVFAEDGVTPTLDTDAMRGALQLMYDLKFEYQITPEEADYNTMDTLFQEERAAMIINGDWTLGQYEGILGDNFGVAPIPQVSATGEWPAPFTSGRYIMVPAQVSGEVKAAVEGFINFAINEQNQRKLMEEMNRLPALLALADDPIITESRIQQGSLAQLQRGTPMPSVPEMRAVWDAITPEQNRVLAGEISPAEAARNMQEDAEAGIRQMQ